MEFGAFDLLDEAIVVANADGKVLYLNTRAKVLYPSLPEVGPGLYLSIARQAPSGRLPSDAPTSQVEDRRRLRAFVDALADAALFVDAERRVVVVNQALADSLGVTPRELEGRHALDDFPTLLTRERAREFERVVAERRVARFEDEQGGQHYFNTISPSFDADGEFAGAAIVSINISELKREHALRLEVEERLSQAQRLESIGRLAGGVAHDFNNLLTGIFGFVELGLAELDDKHPLRDYLESILDAGQHAAHLTRQLLTFSRRQVAAPRVLDLNEVVESTRLLLARVIGEDIELRFLPASATPLVRIDPTQANQILLNLATNARDAMPNGGRLTLETSIISVDEEFCRLNAGLEPGAYVQLTVSDSGIGMAATDLERVFEPFFTTKTRDKGTGLGLATVHGIVSQNGGIVSVYSEQGVGTTFKIYLPFQGGQSNGLLTAPKTFERRERAGGTILLVEDERLVREVAKRILERAGYVVVEAANGHTAIELHATLGQVSALVTDVIMPDMNGKELLLQLTDRQPDIKCVFMSGYADDIIVHRGVLDPGVNFVEKPFSAQSLTQKLEQVLNDPAARGS